jgi:hypothetical protein
MSFTLHYLFVNILFVKKPNPILNPILNPIKLISMPFPLLVNVIVILVVSSQIEYGRAGGKIRNENIINVSELNVLLKN